MNSSTFATSYCASPALATLYAPPRTRVAQVIETVPGWRGFGHVQRIAIVANAMLLVLLAGLVLWGLRSSYSGAPVVFWTAALCAVPLLSVLGLWPCRTWRPLRALMLLANLANVGIFSCLLVMLMMPSDGELQFSISDFELIGGAIVLIGLLPPGTALWAQWQGWRRG